ncbi:MAG: hypothetical protein RL145_237 [Pseudomonadota bacterium]|jgi:hypothetical protein
MKGVAHYRAKRLADLIAVQIARSQALRLELAETVQAHERSVASYQSAWQERLDHEAAWQQALHTQKGFDPLLTAALAEAVVDRLQAEAEAEAVLLERKRAEDQSRSNLRTALKSEERSGEALRVAVRQAAGERDHALELSLEQRTAWTWWRVQP